MGLSVHYHLIEFGLLLMLLIDDKDIGETVGILGMVWEIPLSLYGGLSDINFPMCVISALYCVRRLSLLCLLL